MPVTMQRIQVAKQRLLIVRKFMIGCPLLLGLNAFSAVDLSHFQPTASKGWRIEELCKIPMVGIGRLADVRVRVVRVKMN
jgi:hypothetical protein